MSEHDWADQYEIAIRRFQEHLKRADDGTFRLDALDAKSLDIDPIVFADLKRSLEHTNKLIQRGELNPAEVTSFI